MWNAHAPHILACAARATDDVQMAYLRWKCMQLLECRHAFCRVALMQMCDNWKRKSWEANEWLQFILYSHTAKDISFVCHHTARHATGSCGTDLPSLIHLVLMMHSLTTQWSGLQARLKWYPWPRHLKKKEKKGAELYSWAWWKTFWT